MRIVFLCFIIFHITYCLAQKMDPSHDPFLINSVEEQKKAEQQETEERQEIDPNDPLNEFGLEDPAKENGNGATTNRKAKKWPEP